MTETGFATPDEAETAFYDAFRTSNLEAMMKTWAGHIFRVLDALTTPAQAGNAAKGLSGPVGIVMMFWWMRESIGLALWFTGLLNIKS